MKLYRLTRCLDQYGLLTFNGDHLLEILGRRVFRSLRSTTQSISETWPEIHGWFDAVEGNVEITDRPDLYLWNDTILVLSPKARSVLNDQLKSLGEFLPFDCGGEAYSLLIPHSVIPADESRSEQKLEQGLVRGMLKLNFNSSDVGTNILFKTDYDLYKNLYCADAFKKLVDGNGLKGVEFLDELAQPN